MPFALSLDDDVGRLAAPTEMASLPPSPIRAAGGAEISVDKDRFASDPGSLLQALELAEAVPDSPTAQSRLAQAAFNVGNTDTAVIAAKRALELSAVAKVPDEAADAVAIQVLRMMNQLDLVGDLVSATGDPDTSAEVSAERGQFSEALTKLTDSATPARLALTGWLQLSLRNYDAAIRDLRRCLRAGGPRPDVLANLGYAYSVLGMHDRALVATMQARHLAPRSRTIAFNLVRAFMALKRPAEALTAIRRLKDIYPTDIKVISAAAEVRLRTGDPEGALREFRLTRAAIDLGTLSAEDRSELLANIALMEWRLARRSRDDTMVLVSRELIRSQYRSLRLARILTGLFKRAADVPNLEVLLGKLQREHPSSELWDIRARLLYLRAEFDAMLKHSLLWEQQEPLNEGPPIDVTLLLADHRGAYVEAAQHGEAALRRLPDSVMLANNVAYAWALAGQPERARKWLPTGQADFQEKPYLVATAALVALAEGDVNAGSQGYEKAAKLLSEGGDDELATFARLRGVIAAAQLGHVSFSTETFGSLDEYREPQYVLLRETVARLLRRI